jgi:cysteine-rich repeat protein
VKLDVLPVVDVGDWHDFFAVVTLASSGDLNADPAEGDPEHEWESGGGGWRFAFYDHHRGVAVSVNSGLDHPSYGTDKWVHLVGTYDGDLITLYVDGAEVSSRQVGAVDRGYSCVQNCNGYLAGADIDPSRLDGAIDEVSLWDEALGPDEVQALYNAGVPVSANALAAGGECGDGVIQLGEACDDGNVVALDGCEPDCTASIPGDSCQNAIEIPKGAFAPGDCGDTPCLVATVSGDTSLMTNHHEITCVGATPGAPEVVYSFQTDGDHFGVQLTTEANLALHVATVTEECTPWSGGIAGCFTNGAFWLAEGTQQLTLDGIDGPTSAGPFELTVMLYTCGNGVVEPETGEMCDDGNDGSGDGCSDWCQLETEELMVDCAAIHQLSPQSVSGHYTLYPDGPGGDGVSAWCDMTTDGGGWTRVFLADADDYTSTDIGYTLDHLGLRGASDEVLFGFGDDLAIRARLAMPPDWVTQSPMTVQFGSLETSAFINGAAEATAGTLVYGHGHYNCGCDSEWNTPNPSSTRGRLCFDDDDDDNAPFWGLFASEEIASCGWSKHCASGNPTCESDDRRFAIFTRRPFCGNGIVEHGEGCDDQNTDETDDCISTCEAYVAADSVDCAAILAVAPNAPNGTYSIDPDGPGKGDAPIEVECPMDTPGSGCWNPIDITMDDFVPGDCGDVPCRVTTITGDTHFADDTYDVPGCSAAVAGSPDLVYRAEGPWQLVSFELQSEADLVLGLSLNSATDCAADDNVWVLPACTSADDPAWLLDGTWQSFGSQWATRLVVDGLDGAAAAFTLTIKVTTCGDGVIDHDTGEACDDGGTDNDDGCSDNCELEMEGYAVDCAQIHATAPGTPSGLYDIYPDGGEASKVTVWCDMETAGGGWTRIFIADTDNYGSPPTDYTVADPALREVDHHTMIAYMPAGGGPVADHATFAMPQDWVDQVPMQYATEIGPQIPVQINGGPVETGQLIYGYEYFTGSCSQGFQPAHGEVGKICIWGGGGAGTKAPFWGEFGRADPDRCYLSDESMGIEQLGEECTEDRRFAIFVRRPVCGNGKVEFSESCDDGNDDNADGCTTTCEAYDPLESVDCAAILAVAPNAPAGTYTIDPDGPGVDAPIEVVCTMLPGTGCGQPFLVPKAAFAPADCGEFKCRAVTVTADTMGSAGYWNVPNCTDPGSSADHTYRVELPWPQVGFEFTQESATQHLVSWMAHSAGECLSMDLQAPPWLLPACNDDGSATWIFDEDFHSLPHGSDTYLLAVDRLLDPETQGYGADAYTLLIKANTCGDGVIDHGVGEQCDDGNTGGDDGCTWNCELELDGYPVDCTQLHALVPTTPSGLYDIYPDGGEAAAPVSVWCDMVTDGGGWTEIFHAASDNFEDSQLAYVSNTLGLRQASAEVMIGFGPNWAKRARLAMPADWVTQTPMAYQKSDLDVSAWIDGSAEPVPTELHYGWGAYFSACDQDWESVGYSGRVCLEGTDGPYWSNFAESSGDYCNGSLEPHNTTPCADDRRFAIQVRRPICGNGVVELGEGCDDEGQDSTGGCTTTCQAYDVEGSEDCVAIRDAAPGALSGLYTIDPDGAGGSAPITVYCDMETDGGG